MTIHQLSIFLENTAGSLVQVLRQLKKANVQLVAITIADTAEYGILRVVCAEPTRACEELKKAGLDIPIMIGGATTSELHVALKIAPVYGGPVVWMKDASQNALVAQKLLTDKQAVEHELDQKYETLREEYHQEQAQIVSLEEARKNKYKYEE